MEDNIAEYTQSEQQKEKIIFLKKDRVKRLWDNFRCTNICVMGCQKEKTESKELTIYVKTIIRNNNRKNFLNLVKEIDIQVQEAQNIPNKVNPKRPTLRHIIIFLRHIIIEMPKFKDKKRILKAARENQLSTRKL